MQYDTIYTELMLHGDVERVLQERNFPKSLCSILLMQFDIYYKDYMDYLSTKGYPGKCMKKYKNHKVKVGHNGKVIASHLAWDKMMSQTHNGLMCEKNNHLDDVMIDFKKHIFATT